jgi:hypothetical protein
MFRITFNHTRWHGMTQDHTSRIPKTLTTAAAAAALNRKPRTLNKWASTGIGPVQPIRINGRLAWPATAIANLLQGAAPAALGGEEATQ